MSEFKNTRDVSTYQKLSPPKSLRGEDDAEVTWDLILKRYPNAAPLLCQMETVIERAEGLLQQLRSPYTHALERSSSFQIADSEDELMGPCPVDESIEVSITSEQDSRLASAENIASLRVLRSTQEKISNNYEGGKSGSEEPRSVDVGPSEIFRENTSLNGERASSPGVSEFSIYESNSTSPSVSGLEIEANVARNESPKSSLSAVVNLTESPTTSRKLDEERDVVKSSSLEAWGKVVGENANEKKNDKPFESKRIPSDSASAKGGLNRPVKSDGYNPLGITTHTSEDSVSEHARRLSALKTGPIQQITKLNFLGKKEELMQRFAGTIATASKVVDVTRSIEKNEGIKEAVNCTEPVTVAADGIEPQKSEINERGERGVNFSGKVSKTVEEPDEKKEASLEAVKRKPDSDEVQGNGDDGVVLPASGPRSAVEILDDYSKICGIIVEYKNLSPSCSYKKNVIVKCCFGGFAFEACAQSKKIAKKDAAAKLLRCLAGRQIDGENMLDLIPFDRKQIAEIIGLGNGGEHETAVRKLYKMCMELNAPEPIYTIHQDSCIVGNRYTVKCAALGITTLGFGLRVLVAKRVAADELLHNYYANRTPVP